MKVPPERESNHNSPIAPHHLTEWLESSVDEQLTTLNLISLSGFTTYEYLLYGIPDSERRNDGRLRDKWLNRYANLEDGGWWVSGVDPLNNWQPMQWGRYKPDNPRIIGSKSKPIKYESPPKVGNRVTYFDVPQHIWDKVAKRYGIKRYHSPLAQRLTARTKPLCFWEWVQQHPEIPIILTEGEKKAACLLSMGFVAIALPGIWNGRVGKKERERLHPDLLPMAQAGRKFTILFDYETKPKTRYAIYQATLRTGQAIEAAGAECEVAILPGVEKGVDDFVTARGEESEALLSAIIDDAYSLKDYRRLCFPKKRGLSNKYPPNVKLTTRFLSNAVSLPTMGLVVLWSGMGTGKTELMAKFRELYPQMRFLNLGHRVNLLKNLSQRLNTEMYSAISQGDLVKAVGLSITVDSLHKLQTQLNEYGCIFIDEACQYLAHLLHSKTCREHRAEILEVLEFIIRKAKLVVLADAHMDDVTVDFFRAMRPEGEVPFIIKNDYKETGRTVYLYEGDNNSALVAKIFTALMLGLKIMVVSDSKKFIKKLEAAMTVKVFDNQPLFGTDGQLDSKSENKLRIWSIHAENSGSEENVAFIKDISEEVKKVDVLLASPSLGTGVDIPNYHFDAVFGAFHAVSQTATECAQSLHRYRPQVPLHIWVAPRPPFGYKETNAAKIKERMLELNEMTAFLIRIDPETGRRGAEKDWALDAYCEIEANRNRSINNLRDDLHSLLGEMGYNLIPGESEADPVVAMELKEAGQTLDTAHQLAVVQAANISSSEYLSRQSKDFRPPEEIVECEKYRISRDYGMPVTEKLVKRDAGGYLISQIIALESLLLPSEGEIIDSATGRKYPAPPQIVAQRDLRERDNLPLCMDWHNYSSKWLARHILGLPKILARLLAGSEICATDSDVVQMTETAVMARAQIKVILNLTIPQNCQPMWLLGVLIKQLGLKMIGRKKGKRGQQVRYYSLAVEELAFAVEVLQYRERQRIEKAERERSIEEDNRIRQAMMHSQYGIEPPSRTVTTPPLKRDIYPLEGVVDTENDDPKNADSRSNGSPLDTLGKLKSCLELLEGTINLGLSVIEEIVVKLLVNNGIHDHILSWLLQSKKLSTVYIGDE
ncbi:MAG: plasmid replication protein, CyRepA1 family [Cyanobacteria bacterium P01_A01_bin.40]